MRPCVCINIPFNIDHRQPDQLHTKYLYQKIIIVVIVQQPNIILMNPHFHPNHKRVMANSHKHILQNHFPKPFYLKNCRALVNLFPLKVQLQQTPVFEVQHPCIAQIKCHYQAPLH